LIIYESEYEIISKITFLPVVYQFDYLTLGSRVVHMITVVL
jgi:hypothetical protein